MIGENGAGKSTLLKILSGAHQADSGTIVINGQETLIEDPRAARQKGHRHHLSGIDSDSMVECRPQSVSSEERDSLVAVSFRYNT